MTTTDGLHIIVVDAIDPNQTSTAEATHLGVGTDDSSVSSSDTSLNNEVGRFPVTSTEDRSDNLFTRTFIDTSEANGNTLKEVGLFTASSGGEMLNHSIIQDVNKNNQTTVTIDVELIFEHD